MDITTYTRKDIGNLGERVAVEYFRRRGYRLIARNLTFKTGELDIIVQKDSVIHIIEVKAACCEIFPSRIDAGNTHDYDPAYNLSMYKIQKVVRTAKWYIAGIGWKGEWQVDGVLVWLRRKDGMARVTHLPQIL